MVVNTEYTGDQIRTMLASIHKCSKSDVGLQVVRPTDGLPPVITATIKTDLDGAKRAAKILNAGKA